MAGYYANYGAYAYGGGSEDNENKQNESTPVENQFYDYTQGQQAGNPFAGDNSSSYDTSEEQTPAQEQLAPEPTPEPQTQADMTQAAAEANANTHAAADVSSGMREVTSDEMNNIYQQTGITADEWAAIFDGRVDASKLLSDTRPQFQPYRDAISMYMGYAQSAAPTAQTQAPAQTQTQETPQNQILPSPGGNYQKDDIYDPSKTYGRQADGSYNYSYSAAQLQNDLAREGYYNGKIDGYFGQQTQEALDAYLAEHGIKAEPDKGADTLTQAAAEAPSNVEQALQNYAASIRPESTQTTDYKAVLEALENAGLLPGQTTPTTESTSTPAPTATPEATGEVYGTPQTTSPVNGRHYEGVGNKAQNPDKIANEPTEREPINYNAMADELFQMDRNDWYQRPESQQPSTEPEREPINYAALADELYQLERNDWYQRPESQQTPERTPIEYNDAFIRQQDINDSYSPNQSYNDNYMAELERMQEQVAQPIEYSDAFIRQHDMNDAYSPRQNYNSNYMAELEALQNPKSQPLEYSDAFLRQQDQMDAYSPYADYSGSMASDDIMASTRSRSKMPNVSQVGDSMSRALENLPVSENIFRQDVEPVEESAPTMMSSRSRTRAEDVSQVGDSMSRALADNQAKPTTNIFAQDAPPVITPQREEQYKTLFGNEIAALSQMYPDASYSQLYDYLRLFYEQNGDTDTEYYRWFNSFL